MLYVFIVSSGSMLKFDMNLAVRKVMELKAEIERSFQIPIEDQVLLCSGGEELQEENMVGNYYGAGTDTNPIFLFRKFPNDCEYPFNLPLQTSIDLSIEDDVHGCANMAPSSSTATVRAALAQRFADAAVKGRRECDELVHAQHLQQQGWAAVIANLEDGKDTLMKRKMHCEEHFLRYLAKRSHYQEVIKTFPEDIEILAKIPVLPKLMHGSDCLPDDHPESERTLLSWICTEPRSFLDALIEKCQRSLEELNEHCLSALNEEISNVLKTADDPSIKEVKGIEERLGLLNKQIEDAKKLEKDQRDLATWFRDFQSKISRNPMVLPDMCGTFQKQLLLMLENHKCLRDILERCTKAKLELTESITYRIKRISRVESDMYGLQLRIKFLEKYVQTVSTQIESFEQVHLAPRRYVQLLAETCRRRTFSSSYMKWASELSAQTSKLYEREISIRKSFDGEETKNIVDNLFPGMDDVPPPFAVECPCPFDQNLPNVLKEDLDVLKIQFPEFSHFCEVLPPDPMPCASGSAETDSAFSSNVPSSRLVGDSGAADLGGKSPPDKGPQTSPHRTLAAPSVDCSSLPSEYASLPNEVFSLTSSPFEEPLSLNTQTDIVASKRTKSPNYEVSTEKTLLPIHDESDGEEFETVDRCGPSIEIRPRTASDRKRSASAPRPNSTSEVMVVEKNSAADRCPKLSKARSDGDAISPIQERLKSSESLHVSTDFQSTEYYIDDSMPSSYTESNATSPLLRGNRMVKSHHILLAELQRQVDEKSGALLGAGSSLKSRSCCNILKLHAQLSALQKFIRDTQAGLRSDLSHLRAHVREECCEKMAEVAQLVENVNAVIVELQGQMSAEKEEALGRARREADATEAEHRRRIEIERQKLSDAESQVANYEEHLQQTLANLEELRQEKETLEKEVGSKTEAIKNMMLEQELELDSFRNQMKRERVRESEFLEIKNKLEKTEMELHATMQRNVTLEEQLREAAEKTEALTSELAQKERALSELLNSQKCQEEDLKQLREVKESENMEVKLKSAQVELERARSDFSSQLRDLEEAGARERRRLEEELLARHRSEVESLRSRYKLAVSTTTAAMERSTLATSENLESETLFGPEELERLLSENRERCDAEKEERVRSILADQEKRVAEAVSSALSRESAKQHKEKARLVAELQVSFNEAINSVTREKDAAIERLRSKVATLESNLLSIKCEVGKYYPDVPGEASLSQSDSVASSSGERLQKSDGTLIQRLRTDIEPFLQISDMVLSSSSQDGSDFLNKAKLLGQSRIAPCIDCTFKISILTTHIGDLILFSYEEKYDNFVAFHFGQYLYFLHSDSLEDLGLHIPAGPTEKWALGVIVDKEFCIARKPSNRYKMNVGTKFHRLKVKPWNREKAIEDYNMHKNSQSAAACSSRNIRALCEEEGGAAACRGMSASSI